MNNKLNLLILLLALVTTGCQKDTLLPVNETFSHENGKSITSFTNLTTESVNRQEIPYFRSLEFHNYGLTIIGKHTTESGTCGLFGRFQDKLGSKLNVGEINVGDYHFLPDANKTYYSEDIEDADIAHCFGRMTEVVVPGDGNNVKGFHQSMQFPMLMDVESPIRDQYGVIEMSRNEERQVKYVVDSQNTQPLVLMVQWTAIGDQLNRDYHYQSVTNYFIFDEGDQIFLNQKAFENIPAMGQLVSCSLWRGNAMVDNQDLFVLAYSSGGYGGIVLLD